MLINGVISFVGVVYRVEEEAQSAMWTAPTIEEEMMAVYGGMNEEIGLRVVDGSRDGIALCRERTRDKGGRAEEDISREIARGAPRARLGRPSG